MGAAPLQVPTWRQHCSALYPVGNLQQTLHRGPLGHRQGTCQRELVGPDGEEAGFSSLSGDEKGHRGERQEATGTGGAGTLLGPSQLLTHPHPQHFSEALVGVGLAQVGAAPL